MENGEVDRTLLLEDYFGLTRVTLPALAAAGGWRLRDDHCFQRVVLDHACGGAWPQVLGGLRPAYRHLSDAQLAAAVRLARAIAAEGEALLGPLNRQSLAWRRAWRDAQRPPPKICA